MVVLLLLLATVAVVSLGFVGCAMFPVDIAIDKRTDLALTGKNSGVGE